MPSFSHQTPAERRDVLASIKYWSEWRKRALIFLRHAAITLLIAWTLFLTLRYFGGL